MDKFFRTVLHTITIAGAMLPLCLSAQTDSTATVADSTQNSTSLLKEGHFRNGVFTYKKVGTDSVELVKCDQNAVGDFSISPIYQNGKKQTIVSVGDYAFLNCEEIARITLPSSLQSIGYKAFYGCRNLSSVNIPNSVTTIGAEAFNYCTGLQTISIPASVRLIADGAFSHNWALKEIKVAVDNKDYIDVSGVLFTKHLARLVAYPAGRIDQTYRIPSNTTTIGTGAFSSCKDLESVIFPDNLVEIRNSAFRDCQRLLTVSLPETIDVLDASVFSGCSSLRQVTLPKQMTRIGNKVFENCKSLTTIIIPDGVKEIGARSFAGCTSLKEVTFPRTLNSVGAESFAGCEQLSIIHLFGMVPPSVQAKAFSETSFERATLYVKFNAVGTYKNTDDWVNFKFIYKERTNYRPYGTNY